MFFVMGVFGWFDGLYGVCWFSVLYVAWVLCSLYVL